MIVAPHHNCTSTGAVSVVSAVSAVFSQPPLNALIASLAAGHCILSGGEDESSL